MHSGENFIILFFAKCLMFNGMLTKQLARQTNAAEACLQELGMPSLKLSLRGL